MREGNDAGWHQQCIGGGSITSTVASLRMCVAGGGAAGYSDAEINDYGGRGRHGFGWRPPVRMTLRARASHPAAQPGGQVADDATLRGTAGFGFWNAPFMLAQRGGRLPDAVWFLYTSPPGDLRLVPDVPGYGWKAQSVHAHRLGAIVAAPPTAAAIAWARLSQQQRPAARWIQRLSGTHEALLAADLQSWHTYRLDWLPDLATFYVDDQAVFTAPAPSRGPLGFVAWLDNQYAVVTPRGVFRSGTLMTTPQWLEIADLAITR
ncbi:MAG: family 16 glycosylhydrolase [Ktedonobacterales bacterium]|nr:family 16 glycosylhydrolase [Ktedonobacterales bacterium]